MPLVLFVPDLHDDHREFLLADLVQLFLDAIGFIPGRVHLPPVDHVVEGLDAVLAVQDLELVWADLNGVSGFR